MLKRKACVCVLSLGLVATIAGEVRANNQDVPAQICKMQLNSTGTIGFDADGVRNNSITQQLTVVCPIVLYGGTGRSLYIGGTDSNTAVNFNCTAFGWDIDLAAVTMPVITVTTGTYTNATIGSFNIPDSVAKLVVQCTIPNAPSTVSKISDFWIQN